VKNQNTVRTISLEIKGVFKKPKTGPIKNKYQYLASYRYTYNGPSSIVIKLKYIVKVKRKKSKDKKVNLSL
jgi:hypothetical protein